MTAVFADTFFWVALTDPYDALYRRATEVEALFGDRLIVTADEVLSEFLTFFSSSLRLRRRAVQTVRELAREPKLQILPQSRESSQAGLDLYARRPDKGYSLTDCTSMHITRFEGITDVLTNDRHFEQEGFRASFRDD